MSLAPVAFALADNEAKVEGWASNDNEGGYDQCSGAMSEEEYRRVGSPTQGAALVVYEGAEVRWAGRFAAPPQLKDGMAFFNATGYKEAAAKKTQRLLIQTADMGQWVQADSDPHLNGSDIPVYDHSRKVGLDSTTGSLRFSLGKDQAMATGDAAVFILYAEGAEFAGGRLRWTQTYNAADEFPKLDVRVQRANGPASAETNETTVLLSTGNNGSQQSITIGGASIDLLTLGLHCNDGTFAPNASAMRWTLTKVRANSSITTADSYNASDVVTYIAGQMSWSTAGVVPTTYDVLPFDWDQGSWLDALLYVAELEDNFVRIGNNTIEYAPWGTTAWTVSQAEGADADLKPLELFDQARVFFETSAGVKRSKLRTVVDLSLIDPIPGFTNTYEFEMEDRQKSNALPSAVADKLVRRFSTQRYAGSIEVVAAKSTDGRDNPRAIRYGDTVKIADWGPGEAQTLRVMEVAQGPTSVTLGVEQPVNIASLVAGTHARKRRKHHRG
jgi:hypothetical protein